MYRITLEDKHRCDLCGEESEEQGIFKSDDLIYLCPKCLNKVEMAPEPFRQSMERTLMGNVI